MDGSNLWAELPALGRFLAATAPIWLFGALIGLLVSVRFGLQRVAVTRIVAQRHFARYQLLGKSRKSCSFLG